MTYVTTVRPDGSVHLGDAPGFEPGAVVEIARAITGSLIVAIDQSPPPFDATFRPLEGGVAQLAMRAGRKS